MLWWRLMSISIYRARKEGNTFAKVSESEIWERDKGICGICGKSVEDNDRHLDHIIPLASGGAHCPENVQVAHGQCNLDKSDNLVECLRSGMDVTEAALVYGERDFLPWTTLDIAKDVVKEPVDQSLPPWLKEHERRKIVLAEKIVSDAREAAKKKAAKKK